MTQSNDVDLGKVPIGVPQEYGVALGDYAFRDGPLVGLGFGVGMRFIGESWADAANTKLIPAYGLVDDMLRYDFSHLGRQWRGVELQLNATNLFDKTYASECNDTNCVSWLRRQSSRRCVIAGD